MLLHITTESAWAAAKESGVYRAGSLATEGFIHCSEQRQIAGVLQRYFRDQSGLLLLHIDPSRLDAEVRYENLTGGTELFPHVYGPISVSAVVEVAPLDASQSRSG